MCVRGANLPRTHGGGYHVFDDFRFGSIPSEKESAALVTVVEVKGASPAKVGSQLVLFQNGTTIGTVGGGKLEASILADAKQDLIE